MKYIHHIYACWEPKHISFLKKHSIILNDDMPAFKIEQGEKYFEIIDFLKKAPRFLDTPFPMFTKEEYANSNSFKLWGCCPNIVYPYLSLGDDEDGFSYLRYAFEDVCTTCFMPIGTQVNPIILKKEPKLAKKYLFGKHHWHPNFLLTDKVRYKIFKDRWGIDCREVLIGKNKKVSKDFVQLEIPISEIALDIKKSEYGKTFASDGSGKIVDYCECKACSRPTYTNQILSFSPRFQEDFDFDIISSNEFVDTITHHLIVSRKFVEFLMEYKMVKWESRYLIPVQ